MFYAESFLSETRNEEEAAERENAISRISTHNISFSKSSWKYAKESAVDVPLFSVPRRETRLPFELFRKREMEKEA